MTTLNHGTPQTLRWESGAGERLTSDLEEFRPGAKWVTGCVLVVAACFFIDAVLLTVLVPLTPQLADRFGVGDSWIGFLFSVKAIVQICTCPLIAKLIDRAGPRIVLTAANFTLLVSTAVYASSGSSYAVALSARAVQGIGSSGILVGGQSGLLTFASDNEGTLLASANLGAAVGVLLGPTIGGWLARPDVFNLDGMFWFLTVVVGLVLTTGIVFFYILLPREIASRLNPRPDESSSLRSEYRQLCSSPMIWLVLIANWGVNFSIAMLEPVAPVRAVATLGIEESATGTLGLMWAAAPFGFVLLTPPSGMLADKFPKNKLMATGLVLMSAGVVLLGLATRSFGGIPLFEVGLLVCGFGYAFVNNPAMAAIPTIAGEGGTNAALAAFDMSNQLGFITGPLFSGAVGFGSFLSLAVSTCGLLILCAVPVTFCAIPGSSARDAPVAAGSEVAC